MRETGPLPKDPPLQPNNPDVERILFGGLDDNTLRKRGFDPREVNNWGISLFRGKIPKGFETLEDFEKHVQSIIKKEET